MKAIYLDCPSGISGNMFLGACLQLGVPEKYLLGELEKLNLPNEYHIEISDVSKNGIGAAYVDVKLLHDFEPEKLQQEKPNIRRISRLTHGHKHRTMADIKKIIDNSNLNSAVKNCALAIFSVIAAAEGKVHDKPADEVGFHEVGAIDSIVDIVGCYRLKNFTKVVSVINFEIFQGSNYIFCFFTYSDLLK